MPERVLEIEAVRDGVRVAEPDCDGVPACVSVPLNRCEDDGVPVSESVHVGVSESAPEDVPDWLGEMLAELVPVALNVLTPLRVFVWVAVGDSVPDCVET